MLTAVMVLIALIAATAVFMPLFAKITPPFDPADEKTKELEGLIKRKNKIYSDIKDLDFEYGIGKMAESDYQALRKESVTEAARVLQRIDSLQTKSNGSFTDEQIEQLIRSKRKPSAGEIAVAMQQDYLECTGCGFHNHVTAKFCSECGTRLVRD